MRRARRGSRTWGTEMPEALDVEGPAGEDEVFENPVGKELDPEKPAAAGRAGAAAADDEAAADAGHRHVSAMTCDRHPSLRRRPIAGEGRHGRGVHGRAAQSQGGPGQGRPRPR